MLCYEGQSDLGVENQTLFSPHIYYIKSNLLCKTYFKMVYVV